MTIARKFIDTLNCDQRVSHISRLGSKSRAKRWLFSGFALTKLQNTKKNLLWLSWASHRKKMKLPEWTMLSFCASAWANWEVAALTSDMKHEGLIFPHALDALKSLWNGLPGTPSGEAPDLFCGSCWLWDSNQKRDTFFLNKSPHYQIWNFLIFIFISSQIL